MTEQNKPGVATGVFMNPVAKEYHPSVSSSYGWRDHPKHHDRRFHRGTDIKIGGRKGVPHLATDGGIVTFVGSVGDAGNVVVVDHGNGVVSRYFHLDRIDVKKGQLVAKGQAIGIVGETGNVTGVHVHWEVLRGKTNGVGNGLGANIKENSINPQQFLTGNGDYSKYTTPQIKKGEPEIPNNKSQENDSVIQGLNSNSAELEMAKDTRNIPQEKYFAISAKLKENHIPEGSKDWIEAIVTIAISVESNPKDASAIVSFTPNIQNSEAQKLVDNAINSKNQELTPA
jgi:Peptidase family M23